MQEQAWVMVIACNSCADAKLAEMLMQRTVKMKRTSSAEGLDSPNFDMHTMTQQTLFSLVEKRHAMKASSEG